MSEKKVKAEKKSEIEGLKAQVYDILIKQEALKNEIGKLEQSKVSIVQKIQEMEKNGNT